MWRRWNFLVLVCCCGPLLLAAQEDSAKDYRIVMAESEKTIKPPGGKTYGFYY
jgi:hypothetical protein